MVHCLRRSSELPTSITQCPLDLRARTQRERTLKPLHRRSVILSILAVRLAERVMERANVLRGETVESFLLVTDVAEADPPMTRVHPDRVSNHRLRLLAVNDTM